MIYDHIIYSIETKSFGSDLAQLIYNRMKCLGTFEAHCF